MSGLVETAGFVNPSLELVDLTAHEIEFGLREHFGGRGERRFLPLKKGCRYKLIALNGLG